ncbi:MAG: LLM class flavin-dependent oxidoreductase [Acidimicrobiia bacterium]|nr:LLM class flavin-dependent oxidoreductase [Acidimicrobiia bacterium]
MDFALQTSGSYDTVLTAARWAEDRGLVCLALPDHYFLGLGEEGLKRPALDAFAQLAGLAIETSTIQLSVLVSPITFRHPAVLYKTGVTLDQMSGGRFTLGIGTGWLEAEHEYFGFPFPPVSERFDLMEEALGYVHAALHGKAFSGEHYSLKEHEYQPEAMGLRIVVGGTGAHKTPRLAGEYADEFNCYPGPGLSDRIARARQAAHDAGRDAGSMLISSAGQVIVEETRAEVEDRIDAIAAEADMTREQLDAEFEKRSTPRGTVDEVRSQLEEMVGLGIRRFYLQGEFKPEELARTFDLLQG